MSVNLQELPHIAHSSPAVAAPAARRRWRIGSGWILPVAVLAIWEGAVRAGWVSPHLLPAPTDIVQTLIRFGAEGLASHMLASSLRVAAGFALGTVLAIAIGALVGLSRRAEGLLDPTFQALRAIPSLARVP